jgi:hypothetical protein
VDLTVNDVNAQQSILSKLNHRTNLIDFRRAQVKAKRRAIGIYFEREPIGARGIARQLMSERNI